MCTRLNGKRAKCMFTNDRIKWIRNNLTQFSAICSQSQTIQSANRSYSLCHLYCVLFIFFCVIFYNCVREREGEETNNEIIKVKNARTFFPWAPHNETLITLLLVLSSRSWLNRRYLSVRWRKILSCFNLWLLLFHRSYLPDMEQMQIAGKQTFAAERYEIQLNF